MAGLWGHCRTLLSSLTSSLVKSDGFSEHLAAAEKALLLVAGPATIARNNPAPVDRTPCQEYVHSLSKTSSLNKHAAMFLAAVLLEGVRDVADIFTGLGKGIGLEGKFSKHNAAKRFQANLRAVEDEMERQTWLKGMVAHTNSCSRQLKGTSSSWL